MKFPKLNLHIHSYYSDGKQTIKQIVKKSIKLNLEYIAITDHLTNSWKKWVSTLNNIENISAYLDEISNCQAYLTENNIQVCLPIGVRVPDTNEDGINEYCDGNDLINQNPEPTPCVDHYECQSNVCSLDDQCIEYSNIRHLYCWALEQTTLLDNMGYTDYDDCLGA